MGDSERENSQFWMSFFQDLKTDGYFSGSLLDKGLVQFCCLDLIKVRTYLAIQACIFQETISQRLFNCRLF